MKSVVVVLPTNLSVVLSTRVFLMLDIVSPINYESILMDSDEGIGHPNIRQY